MKKILFIAFLALLLTGCDVNYKLDFSDESLNENISIMFESSNKSGIETLKQKEGYSVLDGMGKSKYEVTYENVNNQFKANYNYTYSLTEYNRGYYRNQCYEAISFVKNGEQYILSTSDVFQCMVYEYLTIDNVTVSITTNHEVIESNADRVENGVYTWNINKNNSDNKPIKIIFGKVIEHKSFWDILKNINILYLFLIFITVVGAAVIGVIMSLNKKNNRI